MKDLKVPFAIVSFLLVQGAGAVWWALLLGQKAGSSLGSTVGSVFNDC